LELPSDEVGTVAGLMEGLVVEKIIDVMDEFERAALVVVSACNVLSIADDTPVAVAAKESYTTVSCP
jgi:hypothetical protein